MTGHAKKSLEIICRLESLESVTKRSLFTSCGFHYALWRGKLLTKGSQFAECIIFSRKEISICPHHLIFEMYRSANYDSVFRTGEADDWMNSAELDPLPYMYYIKFLSCKTLKLDQQADESIKEFIRLVGHLHFCHPETVCNILGQYCESIRAPNKSLGCYKISLLRFPKHNAAKWLLGVLLYTEQFKVSRKF